jgi:hypothetical protein
MNSNHPSGPKIEVTRDGPYHDGAEQPEESPANGPSCRTWSLDPARFG